MLIYALQYTALIFSFTHTNSLLLWICVSSLLCKIHSMYLIHDILCFSFPYSHTPFLSSKNVSFNIGHDVEENFSICRLTLFLTNFYCSSSTRCLMFQRVIQKFVFNIINWRKYLHINKYMELCQQVFHLECTSLLVCIITRITG